MTGNTHPYFPSAQPLRNSSEAPPLRRRGGRFHALAAVALAGFYAALIFARLWRPDFRTPSAGHAALSFLAFQIDTFTFHGGLAAGALAVVLAGLRRARLALAAIPAVLLTVGPELLRLMPREPPAVTGSPIKVMTVNLLASNRQTAGMVEEIVAADADLLLIQEYNDAWHAALHARVADRYPHVLTLPRPDCFGLALYSKLPFDGPVRTDLKLGGSTLPQMRAAVRHEGRSITVYNLHVVPPGGVALHRLQSRQIADLLDRLASEAGPVIVAGDLNSTVESRFGRALTTLGLGDSHDLAGWGRGSTWPAHNFLRHAPGVRIDHILVGNGLTCTASRPGAGEGSDHRPVLATIGFEP